MFLMGKKETEAQVIQKKMSQFFPLTLYEVLSLLGHVFPGLSLKREIPLFDFTHNLFSTGVGQALLLALKRHLAGQHGVLQTKEDHAICYEHKHIKIQMI